MSIYLIVIGEYANRTVGPAFTSRAEAELYVAYRSQHPWRTLGPTAPFDIVEIDTYSSSEEALRADAEL